MSKKQLDTKSIQNELAGASAFFTPPPVKSKRATQQADLARVRNVRPNERTTGRSNVRPKGRTKVRHSFDVFHDQLVTMQTLQLSAVQRGKRKPKLGDMVQRALDTYLEAETKKLRTYRRGE